MKKAIIAGIATALGVGAAGIYASYTHSWAYQLKIIARDLDNAIADERDPIQTQFLTLLIRSGDTDSERAALRRIESPDVRAGVWCDLAEALARADRRSEALDAARSALAAAREIDLPDSLESNSKRFQAVEGAAATLARIGATQEALDAAASIERAYERSDAQRNLAEILQAQGKPDRAKRVALEADRAAAMVEEPPMIDSHFRASSRRESAKILAGLGAFPEALRAAEGVEESSCRACALAAVAQIAFEKGEREEALRIAGRAFQAAENILRPEDRFDALECVAEPLARLGKEKEALAAARNALRVVEENKSLADRFVLFGRAVELFAKIGKRKDALDAVKKYRNEAERLPRLEERQTELASVAITLAKIGEWQQAKKLNERLSGSDALSEIAEALARAGKSEEAIQTALKLNPDYERVRVLSDISKILIQSGRASEAAQVPLEIMKATDDAKPGEVIAFDAVDVLAALKSRASILEARQLARSRADRGGESSALWACFASQCTTLLGDETRAREEASAIPVASYRLEAYNFLMRERLQKIYPNAQPRTSSSLVARLSTSTPVSVTRMSSSMRTPPRPSM